VRFEGHALTYAEAERLIAEDLRLCPRWSKLKVAQLEHEKKNNSLRRTERDLIVSTSNLIVSIVPSKDELPPLYGVTPLPARVI